MDRSFGAPAPFATARALIFCRAPAPNGARGRFDCLPVVGFILASFVILSGCVDTNVAQAPNPSTPPATNMARRQGVSPSGATVAVASFAGAPQEITDRFTPIFANAAARSEISLADPDKANYLVRGYLSARPEGEATAVAFVLDVFDSNKRRTQRIEDEVLLKGQAADPWSLVDDSALAAVAVRSADDLAAVMTNTPEAIAAAGTSPSEGHNLAADGGQTIVAATPPVAAPPPASPSGDSGFAALH